MDPTTADFNAWLAEEGAKIGATVPPQPGNLLAMYGTGYAPADSHDQTTADVLSRMQGGTAIGNLLRSLAPEVRQADDSTVASGVLSRLARTGTGLVHSGLNTAANWLEKRPEIGPDTLAPLGLAPMGMALTPRNAIGSAGGKLASSLPMDEASRLNRAREMGFDTPAWRGMSSDVSEMRPGSFFASSPNVADEFARSTETVMIDGKPHMRRSREGTAVYPVLLNTRGFADVDWPHWTHERDPQTVLDQYAGYPGAIFRGVREQSSAGVPHDQYVVFDPSRVRSTSADFDPAQSHSANLLASDTTLPSIPGTVVNALAESQNPKGIRAYHGSPHDFDKFDSSRIGTGEGAQAYGHGLYFAENEAVARDYKTKLSPKNDTEAMAQAYAEKYLGLNWSDVNTHDRIRIMDEVQKDPQKHSKLIGGRMYEVRINADPESFLDWDAPIGKQPKAVQDFFENADMKMREPWKESGAWPHVKGSTLYNEMAGGGTRGAHAQGLHNDASAALRDAGVPGIKYLDQGSRAGGEGTRNYVVFDADKIEILKKYGWVPAGMVGGGMMMTPPEGQAALPKEIAQ